MSANRKWFVVVVFSCQQLQGSSSVINHDEEDIWLTTTPIAISITA